MNEQLSFLGTGWGFPPAFDCKARSVVMVSDIEDIYQSLIILLDTAIGERVLQPKYGCNLDKLVFEPVNTALLTYIDDIVRTAIIYHEPRIKLISLEIHDDNIIEGYLEIKIIFEVRSTNTRYNFVYPFYLKEGTEK